MLHYTKYYLTPFLTLAAGAGVLAGGAWNWFGLALAASVVLAGDLLLGDDAEMIDYRFPALVELPLHLALPILAAVLAAYAWSLTPAGRDPLGIGAWLGAIVPMDFIAARDSCTGWQQVGGALSLGFVIAGYGTNVAHELTHRTRSVWSLVTGRLILAMSLNADFAIEHVYGHHVNVGTAADPATAKRGESIYAFALRSTFSGHRSAWRLEAQRLRGRGGWLLGPRNRMLRGYLMSAAWAALFYWCAGLRGVALFGLAAAVAKLVLEIVNYIEHYGLSRDPEQPVRPEHSWNTNKRMSSMVLYSLTRHSAHHEQGDLPFWTLDPYPRAPMMAQGYMAMVLLCLVPPLWFRVMAPRLSQWDSQYGVDVHAAA